MVVGDGGLVEGRGEVRVGGDDGEIAAAAIVERTDADVRARPLWYYVGKDGLRLLRQSQRSCAQPTAPNDARLIHSSANRPRMNEQPSLQLDRRLTLLLVGHVHRVLSDAMHAAKLRLQVLEDYPNHHRRYASTHEPAH